MTRSSCSHERTDIDSWPKLKACVDGVTMTRLADAVRGGDIPGVQAMLNVRPELAHMVMGESNEHRAHYTVLNRMPEMVRVLMEHGADARVGIYPHRVATGALTIGGVCSPSPALQELPRQAHRGRIQLTGYILHE
jgi:hypothetical protein